MQKRLLAFLLLLTGPAHAACLDQVKADLRTSWPDNKTINIVAYGHSVPAGYFDAPEVHTREAYPRLLADGLADLYPHAVINVITSAVGGENSLKGLARFDREGLGHMPRVVLIDYGLNDRLIARESSRASLIAMTRKAKAAGACVILLTPNPDLGGDLPSYNSTLAQEAALIRAVAKEERVSLADSAAAFAAQKAPTKTFMSVHGHPNAAGHRLIFQQLIRLFRE
ncbi:SGNH/GDSL hydrolase family protein [Pseudoxanthomonas composti]|uniref:SGNH/GDSL hydrolase family protein n=1 Tax=Pseudoxanthomonas composti TaxID=2137479 RepID=A0A4V1N1B3_9GAMM|nr:SGNH/GDSL hydrolase family protein [Pseudoxanthomonas composti]RXR07049.1 SGNH/GDSL hydrolase family protein [Pseudoxanthomonas composti]